jgi:murein DD-endopeptidase MepM/ murein hydrolase activator NlpD
MWKRGTSAAEGTDRYDGQYRALNGAHLHFEVHLGSQVLDPLRYLNIQNDLVEE